MSNLEHYFENLLFDGEDCYGDVNKNSLTKEEQEAVEICAQYVIWSIFDGRDEFKSFIRQEFKPITHGHWIDTGSGQECSVCGEIQYGYDSGRHYCPNCGNPMDEVTEKEKSNVEERYNPCLTCSQIGNTFYDCSKR